MQQFPQSTESTPSAGPRLFIGRLLETFFRRWWLYLLPMVLLVALGASVIAGRGTRYHAAGVIQVNRDTLLEPDHVGRGNQNNTFGFDSPATYTSRQFNTLLGTDSFLDSVIKEAGLTTSVESGALTHARSSAGRFGSPLRVTNLIVVNASSRDPELSYRLASATIASYLQWQIDTDVTQSQSAEQFFESLLAPYQTAARRCPGSARHVHRARIPPQAATPIGPSTSRSRSRA